MKARDLMTPGAICIGPEQTVVEAARLMLMNRISGLPVVDASGTLVGMVTEGDFLRRAETQTERRRPRWLEFLLGPGRLAEEYTHAHGRRIGEVMSKDPVSVSENTPLENVVQLMERHRVKRLPVVGDGRVVGIVSRANLLHKMATVAQAMPKPAVEDRLIRDRLFEEFRRNTWVPKAMVDATCTDGVVELWGTIFDERHRDALKVLAENTPGVTAVKDHLVWIEPMSGVAISANEASGGGAGDGRSVA